ncbi:DUF2937 family protein [Rhodovibrionaceae bacterium A322]
MLSRLVSGIFSAGGAAGFSQAPGFLVQYQHQLAGRLAQVKEDLAPLREGAKALGMSPEEFLFLAKQEQSPYSKVLIEGADKALQAQVKLQAAYDALAAATPATRGFTFLQVLDEAVVRDTLAHFSPVVPLTLEGGIYAAAGLLAGVGLFALIENLLRRAGHQVLPGRHKET